MSVHPCITCHEQAPRCECPDGPHHADGRGDVTAEIASRPIVEMTPEALFERLAAANRENARLRAELNTLLAKHPMDRLPLFIAWVDGFVRSSDAATDAVLNAAPSREIEDHVARIDAACAAGASWRKLRAMVRAFEAGVQEPEPETQDPTPLIRWHGLEGHIDDEWIYIAGDDEAKAWDGDTWTWDVIGSGGDAAANRAICERHANEIRRSA